MHKDVKDQLTLTNCLPGKGLVLTLWCDDVDTIENFKQTCYDLLTKGVNWFHQCNAETYQMFEFWIPPTKLDIVREQAENVARELAMELNVQVEREKFFDPA